MIISIEKALYKMQHVFITTTFNKLGIGRNFLNLGKCIYAKFADHIILKTRWLKISQ